MPQLRIPFPQMVETLQKAFLALHFSPDRAFACARLFAETTRDGVYTHGLARFPRLVDTIRNGSVRVDASPQKISGFGGLERWDGNLGPGNLNAQHCMARAIDLSRSHGIACVALRNTNHWMRGGSYGWQAAEAGVIGICWTNTMPNLPAWGGTQPIIGNNPLVLAVPRSSGHVVLDMAISQYSYGALAQYHKQGRALPYPGGFDGAGALTTDPAAIEASQRLLPIGYWKGSGLSILLDIVAATLSLGNATFQLPNDPLRESGVSQVFFAIDPRTLQNGSVEAIAGNIIASLHTGKQGEHAAEAQGSIRYPGEHTLHLREENLRLGIPVDAELWEQVQQLARTAAVRP